MIKYIMTENLGNSDSIIAIGTGFTIGSSINDSFAFGSAIGESNYKTCKECSPPLSK